MFGATEDLAADYHAVPGEGFQSISANASMDPTKLPLGKRSGTIHLIFILALLPEAAISAMTGTCSQSTALPLSYPGMGAEARKL